MKIKISTYKEDELPDKIKNSQDAPKISTEAEDLIEKLGGPLYVYMVDWETLKFRRKKDITKYVLFTSSDL